MNTVVPAVEPNASTPEGLKKAATGIAGLDEVLRGGLPAGRPTLVCGGPGCGKTVLAMEFLVHGALDDGEPGLFVSFEESPRALAENFRSVGIDIEAMVGAKQLRIAHVSLSREEIVETGAFSLDALLIRLEHGIREVGARRIALDSMEALFGAFADTENLRNEVGRLFHWLRDRGLTAVVTGERGREELTRHGFEEYLTDCVILLDHRIAEQVSKRRLRVVKYRGSQHGKDEVPFLIGERGFSVLPIASLGLDYAVSETRVSTGVRDLDAMIGGTGYFKGTTVLISGKAGTGKSSLAAAFAAAACARGERCLYFAMEESPAQLARNMRSIGTDLQGGMDRGLLRIHAARPTFLGLEEHLVSLIDDVDRFRPDCVVMDPITNFIGVGAVLEVKAMLLRVMDHLKSRGITLVFTALTPGSRRPEESVANVSSLVDTWIALDLPVVGHARRRELHVVKSRGMAHSQEARELVLAAGGLSLAALADGGAA